VCPNVVDEANDIAAFRFHSKEFKRDVQLEVKQGGQVLHLLSFRRLVVNEIMYFKGGWARKVDMNGGAITVGLRATE
jgi:hypothetical protein